MKEVELYGLVKGDLTIGATMMSGRKKPCLYIAEGNCLCKYASFNNLESAVDFMDKLAEFCGAKTNVEFT